MEAANPYAPPQAELVTDVAAIETDEDHEAVRREHLGAESALKVLGWLSLLQSLEAVAFFFVYLGSRYFSLDRDPDDTGMLAGFALGAILGLALGAQSAWRNARELIELDPHQRRKHTTGLVLGLAAWVAVPLIFPGLVRFFLLNPVVLVLIVGSLALSTPLKLYAFWSAKASTVFSDHYKDVVVRWTRRKLRPGISPLAWALIALSGTRMTGEVLLVWSVVERWKH